MQQAIAFDNDPVTDALEGRGPWILKLPQTIVLRRLSNHRGRSLPIPLRTLVASTGIDERAIKEMIQMFVLDFHIPVGAARGTPNGYYLATSAAERLEAARPYINEIRKLGQRVKALIGTQSFTEELGQMRIEEVAGEGR